MTSLFSTGQSISSLGKSMTNIARVEENLATFMKKIIYYEKFFERMGANLPDDVVSTANLLFRRCYEYREEIRDELESSVAYVADAGRWIVGMGDWNSKMEKRLEQVNELVLLANSLLSEYAVTGRVGAEGCRDELDAYLQIMASTITLKSSEMNKKSAKMLTPSSVQPDGALAKRESSTSFAEFGSELSEALSEMFGSKDLSMSTSMSSSTQNARSRVAPASDDDSMNPFAESYQRPVDRYASGSSTGRGAGITTTGASTGDVNVPIVDLDTEYSALEGGSTDGPMSPVSMGEYECLDAASIPKYAAFKSSTLSRRQRSSNGNMAGSVASVGAQSVPAPDGEAPDLFGLAPVSRSVGSLDVKPKAVKPIRDLNYSYDFQCEEAHNPFHSPTRVQAHNGTHDETEALRAALAASLDESNFHRPEEEDTEALRAALDASMREHSGEQTQHEQKEVKTLTEQRDTMTQDDEPGIGNLTQEDQVGDVDGGKETEGGSAGHGESCAHDDFDLFGHEHK